MVGLNTNSGTTPCPNCGKPMGMMTWVGEKPLCHRCNGATTTDSCLHESLSRSTPDHLDGAHMLACSCPKCSWR